MVWTHTIRKFIEIYEDLYFQEGEIGESVKSTIDLLFILWGHGKIRTHQQNIINPYPCPSPLPDGVIKMRVLSTPLYCFPKNTAVLVFSKTLQWLVR